MQSYPQGNCEHTAHRAALSSSCAGFSLPFRGYDLRKSSSPEPNNFSALFLALRCLAYCLKATNSRIKKSPTTALATPIQKDNQLHTNVISIPSTYHLFTERSSLTPVFKVLNSIIPALIIQGRGQVNA